MNNLEVNLDERELTGVSLQQEMKRSKKKVEWLEREDKLQDRRQKGFWTAPFGKLILL